MMGTITKIIVWSILLLATALMGLFFYWWVRPYNIADIKSPAEVITKEVKVGEPMFYKIEGNIYKDYPVIELRRRLVDGVHYIMNPTVPPPPELGKLENQVGSNIIPNVLPGTYTMQFYAIHRVNPIRTVVVSWETEPFEVVR